MRPPRRYTGLALIGVAAGMLAPGPVEAVVAAVLLAVGVRLQTWYRDVP